MSSAPPPGHRHLKELDQALATLRRRGSDEATTRALLQLPRLYRFASTYYARLDASGEDSRLANWTRERLIRAHGVLYRQRGTGLGSNFARLAHDLVHECPRTLRREWRLAATSALLLYGLAALAWYCVSLDLDLAQSFMDPRIVKEEITQLVETPQGEAFRGNFTFGATESPGTAGWILLHNMGVGILFFGSALIPPLYLIVLGTNALMLGAYIAVAGHWGQAASIASFLWCHGTLELQALVLAGTAGLVLVRGVLRPGPWTRRTALAREGNTALKLLAPTFPLLFLAGLIEGFITPHGSVEVRMTVGAVALGLFALWILGGGRNLRSDEQTETSGKR